MEDCELEDIPEVLIGNGLAGIALSKPPFRETGAGLNRTPPSKEELGCELGSKTALPSSESLSSEERRSDSKMALPSAESASNSSGGRRSFSISDLRLCEENFGSQVMNKLIIS